MIKVTIKNRIIFFSIKKKSKIATDRTEHIEDREEYLKIIIKINQLKIKTIK